MQLRNPLDDRETQTGTRSNGSQTPVKTFEHTFSFIFRNARPTVSDAEHNALIGVIDRHFNDTTVRCIFNRIVYQIPHQNGQHGMIPHDLAAVRHMQAQIDILRQGLGSKIGQHTGHHLIEIDLLSLHHPGAGIDPGQRQ